MQVTLAVFSIGLVAGILIILYTRSNFRAEKHGSLLHGAVEGIMGDALREKRRTDRVRFESIPELFDEKEQVIPGAHRLVNLSAIGASLTSTKSLSVGQQIGGRITVNTGFMLVRAQVVWRRRRLRGFRYGLRFHSVEKVGM
jgi:hypothetical protein